METVEKILGFAYELSLQSEITIERHNKWEEYISPLFKKKFGNNYDSSVDSMYGGERRSFLDWHKSRFKNKILELFFIYSDLDGSVVNNSSEELDDTINKDDYNSIIDNATLYTLEEAKELTFSFDLEETEKLIIKPFFLIKPN